MTFYGVLADFIVAIHLAYMAYVVFGQLAIMIGWPLGWRWIRNPWFRITHLALILIVAFEAIMGWECPLTDWEYDLRVADGQVVRSASDVDGISFTGRVLRSILFFDVSWAAANRMSYYIAAAIVLGTVFLVPPRFRRQPVPTPTSAGDSPVTPGPMSTAIAPPDPPHRDSR